VAQSSSVGGKKVTVDLFGDLLGVFRMARMHDHLGAFSRECPRDSEPDVVRRACYQCDFIFEQHRSSK
jgi:hypothetical protein